MDDKININDMHYNAYDALRDYFSKWSEDKHVVDVLRQILNRIKDAAVEGGLFLMLEANFIYDGIKKQAVLMALQNMCFETNFIDADPSYFEVSWRKRTI